MKCFKIIYVLKKIKIILKSKKWIQKLLLLEVKEVH